MTVSAAERFCRKRQCTEELTQDPQTEYRIGTLQRQGLSRI